MGMIKFSVKAGVSMLLLYFVALFLQGERGEATEVFERFQGFAQDITETTQIRFYVLPQKNFLNYR